jgi:AcrR family transcriptional regulator
MSNSKKDQLVEVALGLFCREGFHATGIDKILAEANVAKMTLYKHFSSKEELILATLRLRDQQFNDHLMQNVERLMEGKYQQQPLGVVHALFDSIEGWIRSDSFYGCTFINASAEFSDLTDPVHQIATAHKLSVKNIIHALITPLQLRSPDYLAQQISLLIDGAIVVAQTTGNKDAINLARDVAIILCEGAATSNEGIPRS